VPDARAFDAQRALSPDSAASPRASPLPLSPQRRPPWRRPPLSLSGEGLVDAYRATLDSRAGRPRVQSSLDATKVLLDAAPAVDASSDSDADFLAAASSKKRKTKRSPRAQSGDVRLARDFDLVARVGEGAFSDVWRAARRADGRVFAIKIAKRPFRSRRARDAALVEARALRALRGSPHVIAIECAWQEGGHLHELLELCEFGSLRQLVDRLDGDVPEDPALWRVVADVGSGLAHVHARGFVHLDVKPSNVLLDGRGALKLGDFGLVAPLGDAHDGSEGETRYLAAETLREGHAHAASVDVFALGLAVYELAVRRPLPAAGDAWHALRTAPPRLEPRHSRDLAKLVADCCAPRAKARPAAAALAAHARCADLDPGVWLDLRARAAAAPPPAKPVTSSFDSAPGRAGPPSVDVLETPSAAAHDFAFF